MNPSDQTKTKQQKQIATMPRVNKKTKAVASLTAVVNNRLQLRCIRMLHSDDEDSLEDLKDLASVVFLSELRKRRYYKRQKRYRKCRAEERFSKDLTITM
jgi:hypothetical protein